MGMLNMVAIDGSYDGATVDSLPYTDLTYPPGPTGQHGPRWLLCRIVW